LLFLPISSGEISNYFININILLPFVSVFIALVVLSFGSEQTLLLAKSLRLLFTNSNSKKLVDKKCLTGAISFSYVAGFLWVMYAIVINPKIISQTSLSFFIAQAGLALTYSFLLAELILRPLLKRIEFTNRKLVEY
jgi:hypothetical protein